MTGSTVRSTPHNQCARAGDRHRRRAARIIQQALGIESDDVANYCFPQRPGRPIASSAPASSASGYKPKRDSWPRDRIPPPWDIEEANATCFIVKDNGQALAYVYFEQEPGRRTAANLLTRDEARRIAANIAKLPELVKRRPLKKGAADSPFRWNSFEPYSTI